MSRYNGQFLRWHSEHGGLDLPGTGISYVNDVHTWLTTDRHAIARRVAERPALSVRALHGPAKDLNPSVYVSRIGYSQEGGSIGPVGFGADPEDTWEGADTLSFLSSRHALRLGGGLKYVRDHNPSMSYGRGAYFFAGAPDRFPRPYAYAQDVRAHARSGLRRSAQHVRLRLRAGRLPLSGTTTLNLGLRYDIEKIANVRNYTASTDGNNLQPRFGVAWRPLSRTIVRGGVGLYTQQHLLYYINRVQLEGADGLVSLVLTPESPLFPSFPATLQLTGSGVFPPRDIQVLDKNFRNPYSVQATAGVERTFQSVTLAADYIYLNGHDLMSLVDANAPASIVKPATRSVPAADATRPTLPVPGGFRNIVTLGNLGRSWYRACRSRRSARPGRCTPWRLTRWPTPRTCSTISYPRTAEIWRQKKGGPTRTSATTCPSAPRGHSREPDSCGVTGHSLELVSSEAPARIRLRGAMIATGRPRTMPGPAAATRPMGTAIRTWIWR
jgi:hypothetical protein